MTVPENILLQKSTARTHVYVTLSLPVPYYYCVCISTSSAAETLAAALFSSKGPVIEIATAPTGAVIMIARTAMVNS